jgi:hypothetical protein
MDPSESSAYGQTKKTAITKAAHMRNAVTQPTGMNHFQLRATHDFGGAGGVGPAG